MPGDPYYLTPQWRALRRQRLELDGYRCAVPGCHDRATTADHIIGRKHGGADALHNLRSLCKHHDNSIKERPNGYRSHDGRLFMHGVDHNGVSSIVGVSGCCGSTNKCKNGRSSSLMPNLATAHLLPKRKRPTSGAGRETSHSGFTCIFSPACQVDVPKPEQPSGFFLPRLS